jgi:6-pyruvoyltetrahydropterin/6-carboxytetrahydropterin synthase
MENYEIELEKLFKFNSSHFVLYPGFREPLHGHNYKTSVKIMSKKLNNKGEVFDIEILKEIMNSICGKLKHKLLIPKDNSCLTITEDKESKSIKLVCEDKSCFVLPISDVKIVDTQQISAECLSKFICLELMKVLEGKYEKELKMIEICKIQIKVSEDIGKLGIYNYYFK